MPIGAFAMTISRTLRHFLQEQHADYEVIPHESTHSAMQSALASSVPADQVAKAVLLDTEDGYLLAVLPANHRIMLSDLTAEFGRRPQLVEEDRLGFIFNDCDSGAIPALASGYDIPRSEEHTSELQSLMRNSYAVFCLQNTKILCTHL